LIFFGVGGANVLGTVVNVLSENAWDASSPRVGRLGLRENGRRVDGGFAVVGGDDAASHKVVVGSRLGMCFKTAR
jgi:hypothetical protein